MQIEEEEGSTILVCKSVSLLLLGSVLHSGDWDSLEKVSVAATISTSLTQSEPLRMRYEGRSLASFAALNPESRQPSQ